MMTLDPGVVVGSRYVLVRPLAKGGMGSVWIARHRDLDVDVTVKFMEPSLLKSAELRARFEREAKVAARLRSQHVVQVLDFGIDDEMPYIAMELLHGESLADRLAREQRLSLRTAMHVLSQICKALRTAHEAGLVHRDLKPGNVFLAVKDKEEVVKVLDFGIVKETVKADADEERAETATGLVMGSVHYMSPEQIRSSRQVDHRSDLWAIAVILYKMLTGNVPFPGTTHGDVMVRVCTDTCPAPSFFVPTLPPTVDAFFVRALTRDPAGRFQSAQEMAEVFLAAVAGTNDMSATDCLPTLPMARRPMPSVSAIDMPSVLAEQTQRLAQPGARAEGSFVSAVLETAPGTFQAVTMPRGQGASLPARTIATRTGVSLPAAIAIAVGVGGSIAAIGLVLLVRNGPSPATRIPIAKNIPIPSATAPVAAAPAAPVVSAYAPASASVPAPLPNPPTTEKVPSAVTAVPAAPKFIPRVPTNPLDIAD